MVYTVETRSDTSKSEKLLETLEIRVLRSTMENMLKNQIRNDEIRRKCNMKLLHHLCYINTTKAKALLKICSHVYIV